jgi:hypothetical protein
MKSVSKMSPADLREAAHEAIIRELGVAGLMRYMREQSLGNGDYTRDRDTLLPDYKSAEEVFADVEAAMKQVEVPKADG